MTVFFFFFIQHLPATSPNFTFNILISSLKRQFHYDTADTKKKIGVTNDGCHKSVLLLFPLICAEKHSHRMT